jgi:hypothetical protein
MFMLRSILAAASAATLVVGVATYAYSQNLAQSGANVGSLTCNVAGGIGFVFGSSKDLSCLFTRTNGTAEKYTGSIKKFGIDIGFTKEAQVVWLVFAPGNIAPGALAGSYGGATASATVGVGAGANVLVGGSSKQVTLQPVSVEGSVGLNAAAGIGVIELQYVK